MSRNPSIRHAVALLIAMHVAPAMSAGTAYWVPITDGTTWAFLESGSWYDSLGNSGSHGPTLGVVSFTGIDYQVIDHRASLKSSNDWYLMETPNGYYRVAEKGDPNLNLEYRYYADPQPFMTKDVLDVGQSLHASGVSRGQWPDPGGGYEAWTGTWDLVRTNLGSEWVTTPLGTFEAVKFLNVNTSTNRTPATRPLRVGQATWTEYIWFVESVGIVKVSGSGIDQSDFDGDGFADWWSYEELTYLATPVPEPASTALLGMGMALLLGLRQARRRSISLRPSAPATR